MAKRHLTVFEPKLIELAPHEDFRGSWTRIFDSDPLRESFDFGEIRQVSISNSKARHTIRGMHYLLPPAEEWKFIHCLRGSVFDQLVEVWPESNAGRRIRKFDLRHNLPTLLVVPPGWAHGFQTLEDETTLLYFMSADYDMTLERGLMFNDPHLGLIWPHPPSYVSAKDLSWAHQDGNHD